MNSLLSFRDVSFGYGGDDVIESASFDLQPGSCYRSDRPEWCGQDDTAASCCWNTACSIG